MKSRLWKIVYASPLVRSLSITIIPASNSSRARGFYGLPPSNHSLWASISRAVRTPSRVDRDIAASSAPNPALPFFARLLGNKDFESETVLAYELGYRVQPTDRLFFDVAAFLQSL